MIAPNCVRLGQAPSQVLADLLGGAAAAAQAIEPLAVLRELGLLDGDGELCSLVAVGPSQSLCIACIACNGLGMSLCADCGRCEACAWCHGAGALQRQQGATTVVARLSRPGGLRLLLRSGVLLDLDLQDHEVVAARRVATAEASCGLS